MPDISIKIQNIDQILSAWKVSPIKMQSEVHRAIAKTVFKIENAAKKEAPVNKQSGGGNLRQSIRGSMIGLATGQVEVGAEYGVYVHEGTRPHTIQVKNKRVLANKRTMQIFGRTIQHPGTKANPFLQRAVDKVEPDINQYFTTAINNVFK